jgi:hypothetical protein
VDQNEERVIRQSTPPFAFFFLVLPHGISSGFVSVCMTALNRYIHDKCGPSRMLMGEALAAIVCVIAGRLVLRAIANRSIAPASS